MRLVEADAVFRLKQQEHAIVRSVQEDFCQNNMATIMMLTYVELKFTSQD